MVAAGTTGLVTRRSWPSAGRRVEVLTAAVVDLTTLGLGSGGTPPAATGRAWLATLAICLYCSYSACMPVAITVRDVPDEVRDELAARAARAGQSLQEYLRAMLVQSVAKPPVADVIARARTRVTMTGSRVDAEAILDARDADRR